MTRQGGVKMSGDNLHRNADCDLTVAILQRITSTIMGPVW